MEINNQIMTSPAPDKGGSSSGSLGSHLARRLAQIGVGDVSSVPSDFNLTLLDHLIAEPGLSLIGCCNELNAGYARANLPVICIVGGPNSNDYGDGSWSALGCRILCRSNSAFGPSLVLRYFRRSVRALLVYMVAQLSASLHTFHSPLPIDFSCNT
ncbi:hypothetical protein RJ640_003863 [Escallonia rubra]|uniref:pyruvate decarboxylase n=1 Tax=Escallonia rubra TaxID=112253 RepID=A0AA88UER5_9ASTE|nr:hypothetical protein RJ640_003863 [Escallonia rubra]